MYAVLIYIIYTLLQRAYFINDTQKGKKSVVRSDIGPRLMTDIGPRPSLVTPPKVDTTPTRGLPPAWGLRDKFLFGVRL